ncbi:hypothetical protein K456DRAFT_570389 [Colletotrichum gloeosporioides 23]|nr:hypothetical protein K456DRAFT_570389 [Colletotrichum gloeosporioides 23]
MTQRLVSRWSQVTCSFNAIISPPVQIRDRMGLRKIWWWPTCSSLLSMISPVGAARTGRTNFQTAHGTAFQGVETEARQHGVWGLIDLWILCGSEEIRQIIRNFRNQHKALVPWTFIDPACSLARVGFKLDERGCYSRRSARTVSLRHSCSSLATAGLLKDTLNHSSHAPAPQQLHTSENITPLSFPTIFRYISQEMPITIGGLIFYQTESSLYYIQDPGLRGFNGAEPTFLENVTAGEMGIRLSQLLNTYFQLTQLSLNITAGSSADSSFEPNVSVSAISSQGLVLFDISSAWATGCLTSCVILLAAGIFSVILAHWARSPEILGYVSTAFRDSRHMELEAGSDRLTAVELSKAMMGEKIRYGAVSKKDGDELRMGVGRQEEVKGFSNNPRGV